MRRILGITLTMLAMTTTAIAADNTLGTWKYDTAKSKQAPGVSPIKSLTTTYAAANGGIKVTGKGERADGTKIDITITAKYDGKEAPVIGSGLQYDTVSMQQVDANTLTMERTKKGTKYHVNVRSVVSADGKTLTQTATGTDAAGKPLATTTVYDKQ
jgi:hypothetical protein